MNPIQQAWLSILSPISGFVNDKLAKRSGLLGKIGRFFLIGPREYGIHPMNQAFVYMNRRYMFASAVLSHRYSVLKGMTHNGYHMMRPMRTVSFLGPLFVFAGCFRFVFFKQETKPDNLDYVIRRSTNTMQYPLNTLNQRSSAHYTEISTIYSAEMMKKYHKIHKKIIQDRSFQTDQVKKTRYAHPSYKYEAMTPIHVQEFSPI